MIFSPDVWPNVVRDDNQVVHHLLLLAEMLLSHFSNTSLRAWVRLYTWFDISRSQLLYQVAPDRAQAKEKVYAALELLTSTTLHMCAALARTYLDEWLPIQLQGQTGGGRDADDGVDGLHNNRKLVSAEGRMYGLHIAPLLFPL